jgi:hypothetical protein
MNGYSQMSKGDRSTDQLLSKSVNNIQTILDPFARNNSIANWR